MVDNFQMFKLDDILDFLLDHNIDQLGKITLNELKNPTMEMVQKIYVFYLMEFGFSESLLLIPFDALDDIEHQEVYREFIPTLNLLAAINHIFSKFGCIGFGIQDLISPTAKRTQKYISVIQNFWSFCNQQVDNVDAIQNKVKGMVDQRKQLEKNIDDFKVKINEAKVKALQDKQEEEEYQKKMTSLEDIINNDLMPRRQELLDRVNTIKNELASVTTRVSDIKEKVSKMETEKERLQGRLEGAQVIQQLTAELRDLEEEMSAKEKRKREFRRSLEVLDRVKRDFTAFHELAQQVAQEHQKTKDLSLKIRDQLSKREGVKLQNDDYQAMIREHDQQISELTQQMGKIKLQWGRKKQMKGEEVESLTQEVEVSKKKMGEEEMAGLDLLNRIHSTELELSEIETLMQNQGLQVKANYSKLLESIEKFNDRLNQDFAKLDEAKGKILAATTNADTVGSRAPPAL